MTKGVKRIVISGAAIAVFALLIVIFVLIFPAKDDVEPSTSDAATETPVYYIVKEDGNDLKSMTWHWQDGSEMNVKFNRDDSGKLSYDVTPDSYYFEWNTSKFRSMMFTVSSLTAMGLVEAEPKDLSIYGLDKPTFTMTMEFSDKTINLYMGKTTIDSYTYCRTDTDDAVYMIGTYLSQLIERHDIEYRLIDVFPTYEDEEIYENINYVYLQQRDGTPIEIVVDEDLSMEGNETSSSYMVLQPVRSSSADDAVQEKVLDVVATVSYTGIYGDITADRLADFGLDKPARLRMEDTSGNVLDIMVGGTDSTNYFCCFTTQYDAFMAGDIDMLTVLLYSTTGFDWLELDYMTILNRTVWVQNIMTVESLDYDMDGKLYHVDFAFEDYITDAGTDATHVYGTLNGKSITETNTKRLYARTLNMREVGTVADDVELGQAQYKVTLNLKDGTKRVLELYKLNERQYCAVVDSFQRFYVYQSNVQTLITAFERLEDDRDLALIYET